VKMFKFLRASLLAVLIASVTMTWTSIVATVAGTQKPSSWIASAAADEPRQRGSGRTIVLGFDGMDPDLVRRWMDTGNLPNLARLADMGRFQPLATTNPAQSPVAWSSFATGLDPAGHGLFDFLRRNPDTYAPEYAISAVEEPDDYLRMFGVQIPLGDPVTINRRKGTPFWLDVEEKGHQATVLRVPVTYPPDPIHRMLSGMGVPDLLGTQGTFAFYTTTTDAAQVSDERGDQGNIVTVRPIDGRVETVLQGPIHPFFIEPEPLTAPLAIETHDLNAVKVTLDGTTKVLKVGDWSDWVPVEFRFAWLLKASGMVRLHLVEAFPHLKLYVTPIHFDPRDPISRISSPPEFSAELAERIGLYHTIGMPEETWSLNENRISDHAYLEMVRTILAEREAMLFDSLTNDGSDLVVTVFVQTDRVSHMFYRGIDPLHPLYEHTSDEGKNAIRWIYQEADRIVGRTLDTMAPNDRLIVLSDHGFKPYRRSVHLNRWLVEEGYLALRPGEPSSSLFTNVDWGNTRAYAVGLNGLFFNKKGREAIGIVWEDEVAELKREIIEKLEQSVDPSTAERMVDKVYSADEIYEGPHFEDAPDLLVGYAPGYRASWQTALGGIPTLLVEDNDKKWSGDHCIDPRQVPGVLFTSYKLDEPVRSIADIGSLVRDSLGMEAVSYPQ